MKRKRLNHIKYVWKVPVCFETNHNVRCIKMRPDPLENGHNMCDCV
jgi:hypothetical protein